MLSRSKNNKRIELHNTQTHTPHTITSHSLIMLGILVKSVLSVLKVHGVGDDAYTSERNTEREDTHKYFVERRLERGRVLYTGAKQC